MRKQAFSPLADKNSKILLLGTMPSEESLLKQEYYGHPQNQFWKILYAIFDKPFSTDYQDKITLAKENGIAIWDVLESCIGIGSADTAIKEERANNFEEFFNEYPHIRHIFFTSRKAEEFYRKHIGFANDKIYFTLPSPSPANARMKFDEKVVIWKKMLKQFS